MWDDLTIGYVAGIFDGEGTVSFGKSSISLDVSSTDEDIIDRLYMMSNIGGKYGPYNPPSQKGHKTKWFWKVHKRAEVIMLISMISDLVCERRKTTFKRVLQYHEERTPKVINCSNCDALFLQPHMNSRYCNTSCANKASYKRRKKKWEYT